jgi:hypothetical protein
MSGEKSARSRPSQARAANALFMACFYAAAIVLVLASCWLFLSNAGELFPKKLAAIGEMDLWRKASRAGEFAGGLWKTAFRSVNLCSSSTCRYRRNTGHSCRLRLSF